MDRFEVADLVQVLKAQKPDQVKDHTWDLLVSSARIIAEHDGDKPFESLVRDCRKTLDDFSPSVEVRDLLLEEISRFKRQLLEDTPDKTTAEEIVEPFTVVKDYDGYDIPEQHYKTKYKLLKPWRHFRAGQTITWWEGRQCVGGYVSGHWRLA